MDRRFALVLLILFSLSAQAAAGTLLHGTVYDLSLEPVIGAVVEVDTAPAQRYLTKDGTYSFELPLGAYTLKATQFRDETIAASVEENVIVESAGSFMLDLILYPELTAEEDLFDPESLSPLEQDFLEGQSLSVLILAALSGVVAAVVLLFVMVRTRRLSATLGRVFSLFKTGEGKDSAPDEISPELRKAIAIIKSAGGRITQKDLRREFPYSEAKVSLMATELVGRGLVKRFKRGRGNVLVLTGGKEDR